MPRCSFDDDGFDGHIPERTDSCGGFEVLGARFSGGNEIDNPHPPDDFTEDGVSRLPGGTNPVANYCAG